MAGAPEHEADPDLDTGPSPLPASMAIADTRALASHEGIGLRYAPLQVTGRGIG